MGWFQASPDPDVATAETVGFLAGLVRRAASDPQIGATAARAASFPAPDAVGSDPRSNAAQARAVFWWAKHFIERVPHSQFKNLVQAFPEKRQLLVDPCALVVMSRPRGDCSVFTALIAALLGSLGIRYELVTVAVDRSDPMNFTHVYPRAVLEDGTRLALDANAGPYPGWQVPDGDVLRSQVWAADGTAVPNQAARASSLGQYVGHGLGDDSDLPDIVVYTQNYVPSDSQLAQDAINVALVNSSNPTVVSYDSSTLTAPAQGSANWAAFATQLAKSGMTLAEINAIQPGTVVSANGQILRQTSGIAIPGSSGVSLAGSTSTLLLFGVGALVLVLVMGKK